MITRRAGVIPYTVKGPYVYFLLGIDRRTRDLSDFGGGVKYAETLADGALREFTEESCRIFGDTISKENLLESPVVTNAKQTVAIFFVRVDPMWLDIAETCFKKQQVKLCNIKKHNELIGVKWVIDQDFTQIVFDKTRQCLWRRIQNIIRLNTTWNELYLSIILGVGLVERIKSSKDQLAKIISI